MTIAHCTFVLGVFSRWAQAQHSIDLLREAGFAPEDISLVTPENSEALPTFKSHDLMTEGAVIGGSVGGAAGSVIAAGAAVVGGLGLLAAGPLLAAFVGAGAGLAVGGLLGALIGLGLSNPEAELYVTHLQKGGTMVGVRVAREMSAVPVEMARARMEQAGAEHVSVINHSSEELCGPAIGQPEVTREAS